MAHGNVQRKPPAKDDLRLGLLEDSFAPETEPMPLELAVGLDVLFEQVDELATLAGNVVPIQKRGPDMA
jgi:hypothetical protein